MRWLRRRTRARLSLLFPSCAQRVRKITVTENRVRELADAVTNIDATIVMAKRAIEETKPLSLQEAFGRERLPSLLRKADDVNNRLAAVTVRARPRRKLASLAHSRARTGRTP